MATLTRYALPTPPDQDGESIYLCPDCLEKHPQVDELEFLQSANHPDDECEGDDCPNQPDDEDEDSE